MIKFRVLLFVFCLAQAVITCANVNCIIQEGKLIRVIGEVDLEGKIFKLPQGSIVQFDKGIIKNGCLEGHSTKLQGSVSLDCKLSGTFINELMYTSWFKCSDASRKSELLASAMNLDRSISLFFDQDIIMDGSRYDVRYLNFRSDGHQIINPSCYRVKGDTHIIGLSFLVKSKNEIFLDLRQNIEKRPVIVIDSVKFDASYLVDRFIYSPTVQPQYNIRNSLFTHFNRYVVHSPYGCSGHISLSTFCDIGDGNDGHVCAIWLGTEKGTNSFGARDLVISYNSFERIKASYSTVSEKREAHAILLYGHHNYIDSNFISDIYSVDSPIGDPGFDSEGVYIKGGWNIVNNNILNDAVGTGPDGSITIKSNYSNNLIKNNKIFHKFGVGIQCYTDSSIIEQNEIVSKYNALISISSVVNKYSRIQDNLIRGDNLDYKKFKAAIYINKLYNVIISSNKVVSIPTMLVSYSNYGTILLSDNYMSSESIRYGYDSYYSAPFSLHEDDCKVIFSNNYFQFSDVVSSQIFESWSKKSASVFFNSNIIELKTSSFKSNNNTKLLFLFRNCILNSKDNIIRIDKRSSLQGITNILTGNIQGFKVMAE